jgi:two-component system cell cycle sensor histidine kinase/response regulator CckA
VIEDREDVRRVTASMLRQLGYRVVATDDWQSALDELHGGLDAIDLVLADVVMPRGSGPQMVAELRGQREDLCALYMTGHADEVVERYEPARNGDGLIRKPFTLAQLANAVSDTLKR